jgi:hypothetical protein
MICSENKLRIEFMPKLLEMGYTFSVGEDGYIVAIKRYQAGQFINVSSHSLVASITDTCKEPLYNEQMVEDWKAIRRMIMAKPENHRPNMGSAK